MLHPQTQALLDLMAQRGVPPTHTLAPAEARALYRERRSYTQPAAPAVALLRELKADGPHGAIALRLYRPLGSDAAAALPVLVYFHGGGWTIGDLDTHDTLCRELANGAGCAVVAVDYRMGPEHRFPAAVDDSIAATRWVHAHAGALALDPTRLAVGGDSAGGTLAATCAIHARDIGLALRHQVLITPGTTAFADTPSHRRFAQGYLLDADGIEWFFDQYIAHADRRDWRFAPLEADDLDGVAPASVLLAECDPLVDEGIAYADRLRATGVPVDLELTRGVTHDFIKLGRVLPEAAAAQAMIGAALRQAFDLYHATDP